MSRRGGHVAPIHDLARLSCGVNACVGMHRTVSRVDCALNQHLCCSAELTINTVFSRVCITSAGSFRPRAVDLVAV